MNKFTVSIRLISFCNADTSPPNCMRLSVSAKDISWIFFQLSLYCRRTISYDHKKTHTKVAWFNKVTIQNENYLFKCPIKFQTNCMYLFNVIGLDKTRVEKLIQRYQFIIRIRLYSPSSMIVEVNARPSSMYKVQTSM